MQHAGRPQRAEAALARPHAQAGFTADVIQGLRLALHDGAFNIRIGGQLALADQPAVRLPLFDGLQAVAQIVRFRIPAEQALLVGAAGPLHAQLFAGFIGGDLGHLAVGGPLAAGDGQHPIHPIALGMVEQRKGARHIPVLGRRDGLLEQGAHPGPGAQQAELPEAGDELLALLQHQAHFPGLDAKMIGVADLDIGGAHHGHGVRRHQDVAI